MSSSNYGIAMLGLCLLSVAARAGEPALDEILQSSKDIIDRAEQEARQATEAMQSSEALTPGDAEWLHGKPIEGDRQSNASADTAQGRGWQEIMAATGTASAQQAAGPPRPEVPDDVLYVYISLSMPKETVRNLFLQALSGDIKRSTIFVLRGWQPKGLGRLVARLNELFPEGEQLGELPNVQINPPLFERQGVDVVPTYSTRDEDGRWGTVVGETSLEDAVRRIAAQRYDGEVIGPTYAIEEPDILAIIRERIGQVDWKAQVEKAKNGLLTKATAGQALPYARDNESYLVDLTIVNNRPLRGTQGEVFAPTGAAINPFDYMTTQKRYIFIDANSDEQVGMATAWKAEHDQVTVVTTLPIQTTEKREEVIRRIGQPVYEINDLLVSRFQLKAVPSIAYQEGRMLRVDVHRTNGADANTMVQAQGVDDD